MPSGFSIASDTIAFKSIDTGGQKVGNGGDGHNSGNISNDPSIKFDPYNNADGAKVHVDTGDHVYQKADWDAGGANGGTAALFSKANGGTAISDGDQSSKTAYQTNFLLADQHQSAAAGIGGDGGSYDTALGGNVHVHADDLLSI